MSKVDRGNFEFNANHFEIEDGIYHDEWCADRAGGGQEIVIVGDETYTRVYAGGTVPLASSLPNINWVTTLDFTDAVSAVTLYSSDDSYTLGLGGTVTIKNDNTAAPLTLAVIITSCGDPYWEVNCAKGGDLQSGESRCASVAQQIRKNGVV